MPKSGPENSPNKNKVGSTMTDRLLTVLERN